MMKIIAFIACYVFLQIQVEAQSTPKRESIKLLFKIMKQDTMINKTFEAMTTTMLAKVSAQMPDTAHKAEMDKVMLTAMETSKQVAKKLINEDMVDIYDKYFSEQEITDFISFYQSQAGQKMINVLPDIQKDLMAIMAQKYSPALQQSFMQQMGQMAKPKKKG